MARIFLSQLFLLYLIILKINKMEKMNDILSERNVHLILDGGRITGSFEEGFFCKEESMYINEADQILSFCKFLDEVGGCGPINIQGLWRAFNNLEATSYVIDGMFPKEYVNYWKNEFAKLP